MAAAFSKDDFRRIGLGLAAAVAMAAAGGAIVFATLQLQVGARTDQAAGATSSGI